jgi:hypothetical protein
MSGRVGSSYDNALAESFFATLKRELLYGSHWLTRTQARMAAFAWMAWYNRTRRHSALGYSSPVDLHRLRDHRRTRPDRQRLLLQVPRLARQPGRGRDRPQANPALPASDQRQGRTPQPLLMEEWAYTRPYQSEQERRDAFPA